MAFSKKDEFKDTEVLLSRYAKALGHPARIAILKHLASLDTCCFGDLLKKLPIAQSTASQHLKELKAAGLIQGSINPPRVNYCINRENWKKAQKLLDSFFNIKINNKSC